MAEQDQSTVSAPWERDVIAKLAQAGLVEQRRARRWNIFFKLLGFAYLLFFLVLLAGIDFDVGGAGPHTALVKVEGVIAEDAKASAEQVIKGLRAAFENRNTKGVILQINSPGGSPVQAGYINDEIQRLRKAHPDIPVYGVIADLCASGGYYIAAATDKVYADKASIVGSIGVRMDGFGLVGALDKLGIEHRLLVSGRYKGLFDPFQPVDPFVKTHLQDMLAHIHQQFIEVVRTGRGDRLKENGELFTGLVWTGEQAVDLGLVDALGGPDFVAREVIGAEEVVDYTHERDVFSRLSEQLGTALAQRLELELTRPRLE